MATRAGPERGWAPASAKSEGLLSRHLQWRDPEVPSTNPSPSLYPRAPPPSRVLYFRLSMRVALVRDQLWFGLACFEALDEWFPRAHVPRRLPQGLRVS